MNNIQNLLTNYLTAALPQMISFCARLLQTPSVNGVDDERAVAELIAAEAQRLGLPVQIVGDNPRRPNVIVSTAEQGPTGLLLVGHLDTVPPGQAEQWTYPPFSGHLAEGKLFGRGAIDTKGGMTTALYALAALAQVEGALPQGRTQLIGLPDEESGATGTLGVKYLDRQGLLDGLGAIYAYSGREIALGHRGVARYRLTAHGQAAHTGMSGQRNQPRRGVNAVTGLADLLLQLEQLDFPFSKQKYFDQFRPVITPGTIIEGGTAINIVPDRAEALVDGRTIPEFDAPDIERTLETAIAAVTARRPGLRFSYELLSQLPPAISEETAPLFSIVEQVVQGITGVKPSRLVSGPANEGYLFIERGIPIICGFGPTGTNAHAVDEYVEIDSLVETALIFSLTARELSFYL
jgi:acetylornithine deacetylase/succinyl-diaminopimelate desuccinylase-like protein